MRSKATAIPLEFIAICALAFIISTLATIHFCHSMCCSMEMPGGWTMSMMWMPMPGQAWTASALTFMVMWLAMMVAMMMPSAVPVFLRSRRHCVSLCAMACGYFAVWLAAGLGVYALGAALTAFAMRSDTFSCTVPLLSGIALIGAGAIQFTPWKAKHLQRCRSPLGCAISSDHADTSFRLGWRQGMACCLCCAAPMTIQLALGIMNPLVMLIVALAIAAEKTLPRPEITARLIGTLALTIGLASTLTTALPLFSTAH